MQTPLRAFSRPLRHVLAVAAVLAMSAAHAYEPEGPPPPSYVGGLGSLQFSADYRGFLDVAHVTVEAVDTGIVQPALDDDGFYSDVTFVAPEKNAPLNLVTHKVDRIDLQGGLRQTFPLQKGVSKGGQITISDLSVDLLTHRITGDVTGSNGVGLRSDVTLWTFDEVQLAVQTTQSLADWSHTLTHTVSGLHITDDGLKLLSQSASLLGIGKNAIGAVTDYGTLTLTTQFLSQDRNYFASSVPEPSQLALAGAGMAALLAARARRRQG